MFGKLEIFYTGIQQVDTAAQVFEAGQLLKEWNVGGRAACKITAALFHLKDAFVK